MMAVILKALGLLGLVAIAVFVFFGNDSSLVFLNDTKRLASQVIGEERSENIIEDDVVGGRFVAALQAGFVIHDRNRYQVIGFVRCYTTDGTLIDTITFFDMADAADQVLFSSQKTGRTYATTRVTDIMDVINTEQFPTP